MSFRLGSFIQAVTEQTYLPPEIEASLVPAVSTHRGSDQNGPEVQTEGDSSDRSSDDALEQAEPKT